MKNITVSVDEETYKRARIRAAHAGTSVSALVRSFLVSLDQEADAETEFDRLLRLQQETLTAIGSRGGRLRAAENLSREDLHRRDALR